MRAKIALVVALASFLAVAVTGAAFAGAEPLAENAAVESAATTTTAVPALQAPACANGVDDDGDGLVDSADPDCESPEDASEAPAAPVEETAPTPETAPAGTPTPDASEESPGFQQGAGIGGGGSGGRSQHALNQLNRHRCGARFSAVPDAPVKVVEPTRKGGLCRWLSTSRTRMGSERAPSRRSARSPRP